MGKMCGSASISAAFSETLTNCTVLYSKMEYNVILTKKHCVCYLLRNKLWNKLLQKGFFLLLGQSIILATKVKP